MRINKKRIQEWKEANDYRWSDFDEDMNKYRGYTAGIVNKDNMPQADDLARLAYIMGCWSEDLLVEEKGDFPSV